MDLPTTALPARIYIDPALEVREREAIFGRSWQLMAHATRLTEAGDRVVGAIGRLPVVLVRDDAGTIRGFHNVCRHRAGPVATESGPGPGALVCAYHGWTYGLDGCLKRAPDMPTSPEFDPQAVRLPELRVASWQGLVFAAAEPACAFEDLVEGIETRLGGRDLSGYRHHHRADYRVGCNWKIYVDNFLEGYHLPRVHPELNRLLDYRGYRTELARWHSLQWSPLESEGSPYGTGDALYYFLWPNTMLNILPGRLQTNRVLPLDVDHCRVRFDYYYPEGTDSGVMQRDVALSDEIQHEDIAICEAVQRGMASGSWDGGPLNADYEAGVAHFHQLIRQAEG